VDLARSRSRAAAQTSGHAESSAFSWRMMMLVCAYSCVIDAINAAVVNAEVRAPVCGQWDVRAQPDCRVCVPADRQFAAAERYITPGSECLAPVVA
jgi:hypothetical protein